MKRHLFAVLGKQFIHISETANNFRKGRKKRPRRLPAMNCGTSSITASNMLHGRDFEDGRPPPLFAPSKFPLKSEAFP
jgi:hypothetical protein